MESKEKEIKKEQEKKDLAKKAKVKKSNEDFKKKYFEFYDDIKISDRQIGNMIKHIVCFKMQDSNTIDKAIEILSSMKGNVPQIVEMEVGKDFLHSARSYDIILQVTLKSKEDLDAYQKDTYHCDVVKTYMHANVSSSIAIDYEF